MDKVVEKLDVVTLVLRSFQNFEKAAMDCPVAPPKESLSVLCAQTSLCKGIAATIAKFWSVNQTPMSHQHSLGWSLGSSLRVQCN